MNMDQERQITHNPGGHMLTHCNVWSPDSEWIVYDTRRQDSVFDGTRIERVHISTGKTEVLFESARGAGCGVATCHPHDNRVVFILGPENPTPDWSYSACHRQGVVVDVSRPGHCVNLDARDLIPPFTPGALRGGSHVHVFSPDGQWVSFTYEDHVLDQFVEETDSHDVNLRNIGISVPDRAVTVPPGHPRDHSGTCFSALVTRTTASPTPGSDQIRRACEEGWIGVNGYCRTDGSWQKRALAFQGQVLTRDGRTISEVFVVDLPEDVTLPGDGPLEGTAFRRPLPPKNSVQRRLTFTSDRRHPGLQGPRHWLRSSPDGERIAFLMKDDTGIVQVWTISPNGGTPMQLSHLSGAVASAFNWSPDGQHIAFVSDNSLYLLNTRTGESQRLTPRSTDADAPLPYACVFSPNGRHIAFLRKVMACPEVFPQISCFTL